VTLGLVVVCAARAHSSSKEPFEAGGVAAAPVSTSTPVGCARERVLVTAHRGTGVGTRTVAARVYSEDTIPAFQVAMDAGVDAIELDLWPTSDGRVAVHHDPTLDRMTDGDGRVEDHTWAEVARLRNPTGAGVPNLEQVISTLERNGGDRQEEIKNGSAFDDRELRRLVRTDVRATSSAYQRLLYTSTSLRTLRRIHAIDARLPLGFITRAPDERPALRRLPRWLEFVHIDLRAADAAYVQQAVELGFAVSLRGVDTVAQLHRAVAMGAARVLTNRPEVLGRAC
jgi:glycerophosphoryl diester phosphodiesterase